MSNYRTKSLKWLAPVALVGVVGLAACGDKAEQLVNRELAYRAAAAHQAEQYVEQQKQRAESNSTGVESSDEFVPVSRHMPVR